MNPRVRAAVNESIALARTAAWPLSRLRPLPREAARPGQPRVVLVHGYLGRPDSLRNLSRSLLVAGLPTPVFATYPSATSSIEQIVASIAATVRPLAQDGPVDLVGHSLGSVACRAWLKHGDGARYVRRFVAIGGPHAGTAWWRFTPPWLHATLRPGGPWPQRLNRGPEPVPTTVVRARYDRQVLPPERASIPGAVEVVVEDVGHNGLLWSRAAHDAVVAALTGP